MTGKPKERDPIDQAVGARIREARAKRSVSQQQLSERLGVSAQQLAKYETGRDRIRVSLLVMIADQLRMPMTFFFSKDRTGAPEGLDAEAVQFAEALAAIPDPVIRRRLTAFAHSLREDLAAAEDRIRAEVLADLKRTQDKGTA